MSRVRAARRSAHSLGVMPPKLEASAARDETLRKIGRNVANFQKMEVMLKFVLATSNFSTSISKAKEHLETRVKDLRKASLGTLVEDGAKALHSEAPAIPPDTMEPWFAHSFSLVESGSELVEWRREMRRVVRERNALIHTMLTSWNPHSVESCRALCEELDAQRERTRPAYEHLQSVAIAIRESHLEIARAVEQAVASFVDGPTLGA